MTMQSIDAASNPRKPASIAAAWGVLGFLALIVEALWRLFPVAIEPIPSLSAPQAAVYILWVIVMAYSEGYRGFQRRFAPRLLARAVYLAAHPSLMRVILAPLFCAGLFHATRRLLIVCWGLLIGIVVLILAIRELSQPWRGLIDGGVVVGLGWGTVAIVWNAIRVLAGRLPQVSPDVSPDMALPDDTGSRKHASP